MALTQDSVPARSPRPGRSPGAPSRRAVIAATGAAGAAAAVAACGSEQSTGSSRQSATSEPLARTGDIPVGGGTVFTDEKVVVTQPTKGEFRAFTSICTHLGCAVSGVSGGTINCPCHGSRFSIEDGGVEHPPATSPLTKTPIEVKGDEIRLA